jgi:uncharacterized protein YbjT (DUF2867 family)
MKVALVAGPTGLVGKQALHFLLDDPDYEKVKTISRRPLGMDHPKLQSLVLDLDKLNEHPEDLKADDVFCCLGTTIKQARTREAFRKVDYDYPLTVARLSKDQGAKQYLLVSALGADKHSKVFYNRVKGEIEEAIGLIGFQAYHIFRPSLLLGHRTEMRAGEDAAKTFFKLFGFLVPLKYKAIDSAKVARAMVSFARENSSGTFIHESKELQRF